MVDRAIVSPCDSLETIAILKEADSKETVEIKLATEIINKNEVAFGEGNVEAKPINTTTKLRPEAPPFMPERMKTLVKGQLPIDEPYFADMILQESRNNPLMGPVEISVSNFSESKSSRDAGLKPFSLVSNVRRSSQKSQISESQGVEVSIISKTEDSIEQKGAGTSTLNPPGRNFSVVHFVRDHRNQIITVATTVIVVIVLVVLLIF